MKNFKLIILILSLCAPITVIASNAPSLQPKTDRTIWNAYVTCKELICAFLVVPLFLKSKDIYQSTVYCNKCDYQMDCATTYAQCIESGNAYLIKVIKRLLYKGSIHKMNDFLYKFHTKNNTDCPRCQNYHGWYIKKS
jgi:hypothetical protein